MPKVNATAYNPGLHRKCDLKLPSEYGEEHRQMLYLEAEESLGTSTTDMTRSGKEKVGRAHVVYFAWSGTLSFSPRNFSS